MSGYLDVKYPFKSNIGLNPFKSWKRQWCILRPSGTRSGGTLAVYSSEAGSAAGCIHLPSDCVVRRAKSRTRPFAFAVFHADDPRKPIVLLASQSLQDSDAWMERIRSLLNYDSMQGDLSYSFSVTIVPTLLSRACGVTDACAAPREGRVLASSAALRVSVGLHRAATLPWAHIEGVEVTTDADRNAVCLVTVDSKFEHGGGELKLVTPMAAEVAGAVRRAKTHAASSGARRSRSRSDSDLSPLRAAENDDEVRRSSWYSGPSDVSLDDIDLAMAKDESKVIPAESIWRSSARHLAPPATSLASSAPLFDDSMSDRHSVASGIYEEIAEVVETASVETEGGYCSMARRWHSGPGGEPEGGAEPQYETVLEVYATVRRGRRPPPPPLPPRQTSKLGESWNSRLANSPSDSSNSNVTRHFSLGSIPRYCSTGSEPTVGSVGSAGSSVGSSVGSSSSAGMGPGSSNTLPTKARQKQPFSVFRKRLKSDSRILSSPKSDLLKDTKDVEMKKKKFDFAPTRDIFKNFKVSKKMKNLKITSSLLAKGETKSCEFLDESEHVSTNRCSKSVECLDEDEFDGDLSIEFNDDAVADLALPQEIVDLILRSRKQLDQVRLKESVVECDYMGMSPVLPTCTGVESNTADLGHYIVMSPSTNRV